MLETDVEVSYSLVYDVFKPLNYSLVYLLSLG